MSLPNTNLVLRVNGEQPSVPSKFCFFIACTEVNAYLAIKYFLNTDDKFMDFQNINNSYTNEKTCVIPENVKNIQLSHILETAPTHAT